MSKIFVDDKTGHAYRLLASDPRYVEFAPVSADDTFDFEEEGGVVEVWSDEGHPGHAQAEEQRIRAALT